MTKKTLFSLGIFSMLLVFASCVDCIEGNGKISTRSVKLSDVTGINLCIGADVLLVADSGGSIKIEGESNLLEAIQLDQEGNMLKISSEPCLSTNEPITITIPVKTISELQINGSGSIKTGSKLTASDLDLIINGSGDVDLEIEASNMMSKVNGSGNIILKGGAQKHRIQVNGSGEVKAENFATGFVNITINGSGNCKVMATTGLNVKIRGSGSVYYRGTPDISTDVKGSGSLEKLD